MRALLCHCIIWSFLLPLKGDSNEAATVLTAFESRPALLPGRIQAENFDLGGEGVAFHDTEPLNQGNGAGNLKFDDAEATFRRDEAVDLSYTKGPRENSKGDLMLDGTSATPGSLYVGWTAPGEWLKYTVEVQRAGTYRVSGLVSSRRKASQIEIQFSGNEARATLSLPPTGSAHSWTVADDLVEIDLTAGKQILTIKIGAVAGFNIDWLEFSHAPAKAGKQAKVDFNREIRPILADNCYECHGPDAHGREGDLRLDIASAAHESAIIPGNAEASPFVERLLTHDDDDRMPPPESPRQPDKAQIAKLIRWIDEGADYDEHWSFVPPSRSETPEVSKPDWIRNGIDPFVLALLDSNSLSPRRDAAPAVLARRLSLTLTGLPVLPERIRRFENDYAKIPDRTISEFVDELLASPAYGEHLAWSWMDAGRYADTNGYQGDGERIMWPWRDWLIRTLNANVPYDDMTRRMLAGDLLVDASWKSGDWIPDADQNELLLATGFLRNHRYDTGSGTIPAESKFENAADRLETVGTVWMGLTLQCARCHTHKFDPVEQREYYEMLSFFDNVPEIGSALKKASHPYIHTPLPDDRKNIAALEEIAASTSATFHKALGKLGGEQEKWEQSLKQTQGDKTLRVNRGLLHRYAQSPVRFNGGNPRKKTNEPVSILGGNREWSISFRFKPETTEPGALFSSVENPDGYRPGIQVDWVDQKLRVRRVARWVNSYIEFESVEKMKPGQWYHVTLRCDGRMQGIAYRATLNGDEEAMICTHPVTNDSADKTGKAPLVLGGSPLMPGFKGILHDLRFYDRRLESDEIVSLACPLTTRELADIPLVERNRKQKRTLELAFIESDAFPEDVKRLHEAAIVAETELKEAIRATPTTMVMKEADRGPTYLHPTGGYDTKTETVANGTPAFLHELASETPDRVDFANWLTHPDHPLTARVAVNRIWQFLWGRGFVDSPENFGIQCAEPVHSELLDWLAIEYVKLGWDTKALIKLIATSRAYRQDSGAPKALWEDDPQNRFLARGPRFRLPVQTVRDQALFLSGRLDDTIGGPPVIIDEVKGKDGKATRLPYEQSDRRRTIYAFWKRNAPHPMLAVFDVADRNQCDVRAPRTNTPLQALVTLNEPGLAASAKAFAERARSSAATEAEQLLWAWQACTGRLPRQREATRLSWTLNQYRNASNDNEELAWTALANVLLNLDSTLSVE